ncbi:hypothetical protein niasHT_040128 [Heterodera trifolii]|uniref:Uncharacterized protein n=1 Tax=Heterodera trifolii TaxID=157864 RepID=A0ABD2HS19_9BILA
MGICTLADPPPHQPPAPWASAHQQAPRPISPQPHGHLHISRPPAPSAPSPMGSCPSTDPPPHQPPASWAPPAPWASAHQQIPRPISPQPHGHLPINRPPAPSAPSPMSSCPSTDPRPIIPQPHGHFYVKSNVTETLQVFCSVFLL